MEIESTLSVSSKAVYFDHDFDNPEASGTYFYNVNTFTANLSSSTRAQRAAVLCSSRGQYRKSRQCKRWQLTDSTVPVAKVACENKTSLTLPLTDRLPGFRQHSSSNALHTRSFPALFPLCTSITVSLSYSLDVFIFTLTRVMAMFGQGSRFHDFGEGPEHSTASASLEIVIKECIISQRGTTSSRLVYISP